MRGISTIPAPRRPRELADDGADPVRAVRADGVRTDEEAEWRGAVEIETGCGAAAAGAVPQTSQ
jgi:hypothetical protein